MNDANGDLTEKATSDSDVLLMLCDGLPGESGNEVGCGKDLGGFDEPYRAGELANDVPWVDSRLLKRAKVKVLVAL